MNQPTQEGFEAWRHTESTIKHWRLPIHSGGLIESEPELAWVYLCESLGYGDFTELRCCAKRHIGPDANWTCENDPEKCWRGTASTEEEMVVLRQIDMMVKDFVANKNQFPFKDPVQRDRIVMVLEDLL